MSKFVELNEAAKMIGVDPDQLVEIRSKGEIRGYRDGTSWKFKIDEVERFIAERGEGGGSESDEPDESILVSEQELGQSGESTSSTVIGDAAAESSDSDLSISEQQRESAGVDSDVTLVPGAGGDSDVSLVPDPGSDKEMAASGSDVLGSDLDLGGSGGSGTGELDSQAAADTGGSSDLDLGLDSELALSDDDDMVLSGGSGSDLSLSAGDSGINLGSPSDSGLSLEADSGISLQTPTDSGLSLEEDSLDMGGSSISSLDLPDDEQVSLDEAEADVQQDEQFMLSPSDEMFVEESDSSGSQVIALEDSEAFDDQGLLADSGLESLGTGAPVLAPTAGYAAELPEAPYSIWNVLGLSVVMLFLSVTGIMMIDIVRNMWAWETGRDVSSGIAEGIARALGF